MVNIVPVKREVSRRSRQLSVLTTLVVAPIGRFDQRLRHLDDFDLQLGDTPAGCAHDLVALLAGQCEDKHVAVCGNLLHYSFPPAGCMSGVPGRTCPEPYNAREARSES